MCLSYLLRKVHQRFFLLLLAGMCQYSSEKGGVLTETWDSEPQLHLNKPFQWKCYGPVSQTKHISNILKTWQLCEKLRFYS